MYVSYCHTSIKIWKFTSETDSILLSCIDRMLNYGLKSQQMVLHANLQMEMVLTIFTIFFIFFFYFFFGGGVIIFNSL